MSDYKFPEAQPIDWDALERGDKVLITGNVIHDVLGNTIISLTLGASIPLRPVHIIGRDNRAGLRGHVIKAPKPLAVGDKVRVGGNFSVYEIIALDGSMAWLRHIDCHRRPYRETVELADLVRVEP